MSEAKEKLPPEPEEQIVELSMKHIIFAFGGLVISLSMAGTSIVLVRDYVRYKRQQAVLKSLTEVLILIKGGDLCTEKTMTSSSPMMTSTPSNG